MAFSINTNITSLQAQNYLRTTSDFQGKTINRVTSGLRIVQSGDDAAGLAVANAYRSDQSVLSQGVRNANDGLSQLQIEDGGLNNISQLLDRARTLATQSATGTFTGDRAVLNSEFQNVLGEIDRQAQAIGLNQNGTFAKSLSVFIGGGKGTSATATIDNGSVAIDLSKSTVDSKSLGMSSFRAQNSTTYDLSTASTTSIANIIGVGSANTTFYFRGAGFSDKPGATNAISISVDTRGVKDATTLAQAINGAINKAANPSTTSNQSIAFNAAGITAAVVSDSSGRQSLTFNSASSGFQVRAGDDVANALLGDFSSGAAGAHSSTATGSTFAATAADESADTISINGGAGVALGAANFAANITTVAGAVAAFNTGGPLAGSDVQAFDNNGKLGFYSLAGKDFTVSLSATILGFTAAATIESNASVQNSGGAAQSTQEVTTNGGTDYSKAAYFFSGLSTASDAQALTLNVIKGDGSKVKLDVSLSDTNASSLQQAVDTINTQLQASSDPTVKKVFAVKEGVGIRFIGSSDFSVTLGAGTGNRGLYETKNGTNYQGGNTLNSGNLGISGTADISNQSSSQNAVTALSNAVSVLGAAQAVIGRGQNQLMYAVNLAQSQIGNEAAAESRIRDADLASESANLSKAQILLQAGIAALAQANSAPQQVLALLRG